MTFNEINNQANYKTYFAPFTNSGIYYEDYEINLDFKIGCMTAMCTIYLATCKQNDILMAQKAMQKCYYFTDVHVYGEYPEYISKYLERKGINLGFTEKDAKELKEECVDYIGFSYYMSFEAKYKEGNNLFEYDETRDLVINEYVDAS